MDKKEIRILNSSVEVREAENKNPVIEGYAAVFNDETVIGGRFAERVAPGAFDSAQMTDTVALFNHNIDQPLARVGRGLELTVDERGLKYRFEVGNQSYAKDLVENIRMGNVSTSSFGFTVRDDEWEKRDDGINLRTIKEVDLLFDVSPTTQGAYPTTEVGLRSMAAALANQAMALIEEEEIRAEEEEEEEMEEEMEEKAYDAEEGEEEMEEKADDTEEEEDEAEMEGREDVFVDELIDQGILPHPFGLVEEVNPEPEARIYNNSNSTNMEKKEKAPAIIQSRGDKQDDVVQRFSLGKAIREAAQGKLTGVEAEMNQEARAEFSSAKVNISGGINVPAMFFENRATTLPLSVGATASNVQNIFGGTVGKQDDGFVPFMQPKDIATQLGVRNISNVSGDIVFQVYTPDPAVQPANEATAATVASGLFDGVTLSPTRIAAHVQVTEQLMAQTSEDLGAFIGSEIQKACDAKFNANIVTAINAAATANHSATLPTYNASTFNGLDVEAKLLSNNVDVADFRVLTSPGGFRTARALSLDAGSGLLFAASPQDRNSLLGYPTAISSSVTNKNLYMMDVTKMVSARWGGLNLIIDPYTEADNGVVRIIANVYRGFVCLGDPGFSGYAHS